ncbi:MAG: hypothetical protein PV340_05775 [Wolbachia sp.]|nr:hypothetical protein [Wolbachia sp.]MDD9336721.1 hypothetical protein [Wolbachia sp.]
MPTVTEKYPLTKGADLNIFFLSVQIPRITCDYSRGNITPDHMLISISPSMVLSKLIQLRGWYS